MRWQCCCHQVALLISLSVLAIPFWHAAEVDGQLDQFKKRRQMLKGELEQWIVSGLLMYPSAHLGLIHMDNGGNLALFPLLIVR